MIWQPIESAPKKSGPLLGFMPTYYQGKGGVSVIHWMDGAWFDNRAFITEPTHWMPLPEPPSVRPVRDPKLKVWGGSWNGRSRAIVCAASQNKAIELINAVGDTWMTRSRFSAWWNQTHNEIELSIATREGVWEESGRRYSGEYRERKPR